MSMSKSQLDFNHLWTLTSLEILTTLLCCLHFVDADFTNVYLLGQRFYYLFQRSFNYSSFILQIQTIKIKTKLRYIRI